MLSRKSKLLYPLRIIAQIRRLPHYIDFFEEQGQAHAKELGHLETDIAQLRKDLAAAKDDLSLLPSIDARLMTLQHRLAQRQGQHGSLNPQNASASVAINNTVADNHEFDYFYKLFEDRFRGSEEIIKQRVSEHVPYFKKLSVDLKKLPIVDIGCGRGEFLSVMKDNGFHAIGIDMNESMVERAKKLGYKAEQSDALSYLSKQKMSSLAAITGFHVVEHIPFEMLLKIFEQCHRTLAPGGFALFETPNPQALTVGANTFYLDPSHQRPIPSGLLSFMLESVGFKTEVLPLHPVKPALEHIDPIVTELYNAVYGAGDYAVLARKIS